jgi:hypothetical protein
VTIDADPAMAGAGNDDNIFVVVPVVILGVVEEGHSGYRCSSDLHQHYKGRRRRAIESLQIAPAPSGIGRYGSVAGFG